MQWLRQHFTSRFTISLVSKLFPEILPWRLQYRDYRSSRSGQYV